MGSTVSRSDFEWKYDEEPHSTRRREIMKKYPHVRKLFGVDPWFKWHVALLVFLQVGACLLIRSYPSISWLSIAIGAYWFGGVINLSMMLAIHDIAHNTAFGQRRFFANRLFGIFANLPIIVPFASSFKRYHIEHHRYLGIERVDPDLPTRMEARFFTSTTRKVLWLICQPLLYPIRPLCVRSKRLTHLEYANMVIQFIFNFWVLLFCGVKAFTYMFAGSLVSMGIHPMAGHFISEHFVFEDIGGGDTFSYYGPMNPITFNVGYHMEHHDLPYVAGRHLPALKDLAPEYYDTLPQHRSWTKVLWDFVFDPSSGPYARVKRPTREDAHHT
ncbi:sphingolipid delta(4)-desaturase DES1-like [Oscarella lobularis]|uniref:sphingolipid delta(4)-desaturase DES1-like n=1 Tax=Oscarella lobularis TaxID=121494 RepID=UPI003314433C